MFGRNSPTFVKIPQWVRPLLEAWWPEFNPWVPHESSKTGLLRTMASCTVHTNGLILEGGRADGPVVQAEAT